MPRLYTASMPVVASFKHEEGNTNEPSEEEVPWKSPRPHEKREQSPLVFSYKQSKQKPAPPKLESPAIGLRTRKHEPFDNSAFNPAKKKGKSYRAKSHMVSSNPTKKKKRNSITMQRSPIALAESPKQKRPPKKRRSSTFCSPTSLPDSAFVKPNETVKKDSPRISTSPVPMKPFLEMGSHKKEKSSKKLKSHSHVDNSLLDNTKEGFFQVKEKNSKKWHRRWVALASETLRCHKDIATEPLLSIHLNYAAVKRLPDKPDVFEVITSQATYLFSVENEKENVEDWIKSINSVCEKLVLDSIENDEASSISSPISRSETNDSMASDEPEDTTLQEILQLSLSKEDGNTVCADCGAPSPDWASTNLGNFICLQCSGVHRSFGTHISQVRSVRLDKWTPTLVSFMKEMGNNRANVIWEHHIPEDATRITADTPRDQRQHWLEMKYVEGRFREDYVVPEVYNPYIDLITPKLVKSAALANFADPDFCTEVYALLFD